MTKKILELLTVLLALIIMLSIEGLMYWGIGSLLVWLLHIEFNWTFSCGVATSLFILLMKVIKNGNS